MVLLLTFPTGGFIWLKFNGKLLDKISIFFSVYTTTMQLSMQPVCYKFSTYSLFVTFLSHIQVLLLIDVTFCSVSQLYLNLQTFQSYTSLRFKHAIFLILFYFNCHIHAEVEGGTFDSPLNTENYFHLIRVRNVRAHFPLAIWKE